MLNITNLLATKKKSLVFHQLQLMRYVDSLVFRGSRSAGRDLLEPEDGSWNYMHWSMTLRRFYKLR